MDTPIEQNYAPHQLQTASRRRRFLAALIDWGLAIVWTIGIGIPVLALTSNSSPDSRLGLMVFVLVGYYAFVAKFWRRGQTPGKSTLNLYYIRSDGYRAGGGYTMLRDFLLPGLISVAFTLLVRVYSVLGLDFLAGSTALARLLTDPWLLWDPKRQTLTDKIARTYVAHSPEGFVPTTKAEGIPLPGPQVEVAAPMPTTPDVLGLSAASAATRVTATAPVVTSTAPAEPEVTRPSLPAERER